MKHIHLIGIGGSGISSIARVLLEKGYTVSGSDRILSFLASDLQASGVSVFEGHAADNITGADLIVRSSAINDENVEVIAARQQGIPVLKRSDFLGTLMEKNIGIAVAGTHGKTTTSALMAWSLVAHGMDPSYILGGVSKNLAGNAHAGKGDYFVIEADEYDRMFLGLKPSVILLTNVDYDHPDCFPTRPSYIAAFSEFVSKLDIGGLLVTNGDDPVAAGMVSLVRSDSRAITCGLRSESDYSATNLSQNDLGGMSFDLKIKHEPGSLPKGSLQIPGEHNVRNALGVFAALHQLGLPVEKTIQAFADFKGTGRRFDILGEVHGVTIISDYAHHPTKIQATLSAAKLRFPGQRIVAVWQPHTFSRTRALESEFIHSLEVADHVVVTEIYASRETTEAYSSASLVQKMPTQKAVFVKELEGASDYLLNYLRSGDVVIILSAGDADQICATLLTTLKERQG